ncbi:hypothetical protein VA249_31990 [Vibrio alfacsensis]|uniref:retention module-containing protein n=1 Tax=Vibrio alfacsensis TaxID=1074311 RepID=UPI001BEE224C|nr:hypothetical protein VA249_31990 [Vibrio alfacsensis]
MSTQTLPQEVVVDAVKGEVYAIDRDGNIRIVGHGETLMPGEVIITINGASIDVIANGSLFLVDENCFACIPEPKLGQEDLDVVTAEIEGKVSVDPTVATDFDADDVAAIQQAILEGADPTAILEATAAGPAAAGGASGSANAGFVTIEYNNPEVLASTFFETTASFDNTDLNDDLNGFDITILADGGQSLSSELTEGSISLSSYPQSITSQVIVDAADLPLEPNSFVPEPTSLALLLEELSTDITSGGESVSFVFSAEQNAIIGTQDGQDVIRIDIEAISAGRDVQLEVVTTISQGIDHVPSVADGLVSFDNDQIQIAFDIIGSDIGGNSILSPVDIVTTIADGDDPSVQNITIENVESSSALIEGRFIDIGSDQIATATFDQESLAQFDGLLSDSLTTIASLSDDGSRITLSIADTNDVVLTISLNTDGTYQFEQFKPLQHDGQTEEILLTLPTTTVDFDQDVETSTFTIKIIDDQLDIVDVDALRVDENDISNVGSEQDAPAFAMGQITISQDSDGAAQYRLDGSSNPVDGLTSHGAVIALLESDNPDGGFTYTATANGETVFTFVVNRDGTYNFTLQGPIDHAIDSDELTINFPVVVTDFDGDTAVATIPVTIDDDTPTISGVEALLVDEDDILLIGSEQNDSATVQGKFTTVAGSDGVASYELSDAVSPVQGLTSQGDAVTLEGSLNADGSYTYSATANGASVFELTLQVNGEYTFTLQGPIDHAEGSDSLQLNFPIVATDLDGDTTTSTIPVTIVDDKPSITSVVALEVDEDGLNTASPNTLIAEGKFTTTQGSDKVISYQLEVGSDPVSGLTSQGQPITLTEVSNSDGSFTYIATANGNQVFTLNVSPDGSYNFKLESQIDHEPDSGRLTIEFPIVATDFDGDTTTAIIPVQIIDDAPIIDDVIPLNVNEDDLPNIGSDENESVYVEGRFTTDQGADRVVSYQLDSSTNPVDGLTSQGNVVTLQESENQDGSFTYIATADGNPVFTMNVNIDGSYDFKLEGPIDHPLGSDGLTLDFSIIATDFDGDTTTATIPVTISDDKPALDGLIDGSVTKVDEDDIQAIGSEGSSQLNSVKGNFNAIDGSDGIVEYQVTDLDSPVKDLTSGGQDLVLVEVSNSNGVAVYEARIDGTTMPVFRITLDASDDSYQFDLLAPLDHAIADGENELVINLPIQATDYDGDESNVQTLPITVVDDVPTISGVTPNSELTVDEDDLPKGSDEASPQDTLIGGTLDITEGADQVVSIQLNNLESPVKGLTSGGDAIALILTSSSGGVNVYQGVAGTPQAVIFELTLDARDNSYQFDLKKPLDHPDGDTENQIILELPVTATDKDGDESPEYSLAIKVVDDIPVVTSIDTLEVNEDDLSQGSDPSKEPRVDSGQFDVTSADGIDSFELDLTPGKIPTLTSGGDEVSITLDTSASSATSLVYVGETAGGETIFTLTLHQDGRYDFELSGPLDHAVGSDEILLNLPIIITDGDKDAISATLPVKIADDKPALDGLIDGSVTKIDEDDIQTIGSEGSSQINSVKGNFNAIDGSDGIVEYQVTDLDSPVKDLTSGGQDLVLVEVSNSNGVAVYEARIDGTTMPVFRITLDASDDSYQFDLLAPLDHAIADGENELVINLPIQATDYDGDESNVQTLPITVVDDVPTISGVTPNSELTVDEDDLPKGSDEASPQDTLIGGTLDITEGADQVVSIQLNNLESPVKGLTSGGDAIALILTSSSGGVNVYQGVAGTPQAVIFELTLDARDNSYQFDLKKPLDHPDGDTENQIILELPVTATDKDGDESPEYSLAIKVVDDIPVVTSIDTLEVNEDDLSQGSDPSKEPRVDSGQFDVTSADGIDSFELDLTPGKIPTLTSGGDEVSIALDSSVSSATSLVYVGETAGGETIFTLTLHQDGRYDFELSGPLDHAAGSDEILLNLPIIITDGDKDAISATLPVKIADDKPALDGLIDGSVTKIDEDDIQTIGSEGSSQINSVKGNFNAIDGSDGIVEYQVTDLGAPVKDLTSAGQDLVLVEVSNSNGVSIYEARIDGTTTPVFRITLDASDDSYQFDLLAPLDHPTANGENELVINLPIQATDYDGDVSNVQTLPITVVDDIPVVTSIDTLEVNEDDLSQGSDPSKDPRVDSGQFDVTSADGIDSFELDLTPGKIPTLTSGGDEVSITLDTSASSATSLVYVGETAGGETIFTLTLHQDGRYDFELSGPLDHAAGSDEILLNLPIIITDGDKDAITATLPVKIADDKPALDGLIDGSVTKIDEDDIQTIGSEGSSQLNSIKGNFNAIDGSDGIVEYQVTDLDSPVKDLTSGGQDLVLVEVSNSNGVSVYEARIDGTTMPVFRITLDASDDSYQFDLLAPLDHATADGENELVINLPIQATDYDGDVSNVQTLPITVVDDVPTISGVTPSSELTVDEDDLPKGSDEASPQDTLIGGTLDITEGADQVVSIQLNNLESPVKGLTSGGDAITLILASSSGGVNVYQGVAGTQQQVVFELTLDARDNSYQFDLKKPLEHPDGDTENQIILELPVTAMDKDGDESPEYSLAIKVVDDIPVVTSIDTLEVNEDDLSQGSDPSKEPRIDSGQFDVTSADGIDSFELDLTPGKIPTLTSGGDEVSITLDTSASSATSLVYIGETAGGETIFTLTLHQDGRYDFELSGPLDHAVGSDEILLNLPIIITDGDKDAITATLPVKIADDKPALDGLIDGSVTKIDEDDIQTIGSEGSSQLNSVKGNFNAIDGSDGIVEYQITDLDSAVKDLTSGGQDLVLVEVSNSNGVAIYEARIDGTATPVFRITLDASDDSYQFDLLAPLDHAIADGENELVINLPIQATDYDGDVSNVQTLPITVVDDLPALIKVDDSSTTIIDEDDLKVGSDTTGPRSISGSFDVIDGADQITHYQVADLDAAVSGLQSNKQDIELKEVSSNGGVTIYEAVIVGTSTQVFTLTLDANNDTYQFDLIRPVDHASGGAQNRLTIDIPISATDYDGDTTTSVDLPITIVDDVPEIKSADTLFLDEDDLPNGSEVLKDSLEATGNFDTEQGADTVASYQLTLSSQPIPGITSEGQSVTLVQTDVTNNNYTYQGKTPDGKAVFTVLLNSDGSYKFTLNGVLDHGTQGEDELTVNLPVFATDVDGDVSSITLPVVITDDVPTIHNNAISVVEGKGSSTIQLFLDPTDNDLDYGADGAEITSFTAEPSDVYFVVNGANVAEVELNGSDKVVSVYKMLDGVDTEIGRLTVKTDGSVRFRANDDLDHSEADPINFTLKVTATDGDKDISTSDVDISITDRDGKIQTANVLTFEDRGRDGVIAGIDAANPEDNLSTLDVRPANVNLVVDLNDVDRNETLGDITILKANTHNGTFYYRDGDGKFVELVPTNNKIVLDASNVDQTVNGELVTLNNLFFIPERHFSTDEDGFSPRIQVEILNNGTVDHVIGGRLNIQVDSIADIATWKTTSTFDYVVDEDDQNVSLSIEAETQDTSDPETIVYELVFTGGESNASLVYSDGTPLQQENGKYFVDANRIGDVEVDPIDNFSGSITLNITAITTERENALSGKQTVRSETQEIVIDVQPVADEGAFSVNRINIFEDNARTQNTIEPVSDHDPLLLNEVINMKPSSDVDGSETLFVRISNFSDDGVTLVWLDTANPSQINTVTDSSGNVLYYEIPESHLADVEVLPPLHSNEDFTFDVEGIIKDNATLSSGPDQDVLSLGTKTVNVAVKGVADIPDIILIDQNNDWQIFSDATGAGIETTIPENGAATLSFSVVSGEFKDAPLDGSESLTVILSNIPNGVNVVDADGDSVDLTFVGYDSKGEPIYEANITGRNFNSGIQIIPTESSTENIHITGTLIVTENDGHTRIVDREIRIKVEPVIDAQDNYVVTSEGNEDTRINIDWEPSATQSPDADEFYAALTISGFPPGSTVYVDGSAQLLTGNSLTLTPLPNESEQDFSARVTQTGYIQVQLEENSSTDFDLLTQVTVKEVDAEYVDAVNPGEGIVSSVINGTVKVQVNPVVENENLSGDVSTQTRLLVEEADGTVTNFIRSTDLGNIDFTINTSDGGHTGANIIKYQEFDLSSKEVVTQLVVQFNNVDPDILDQLIIIGASNEGNGRWTITDENNFTILAPAGLDLTPDVDTDDTGYSQIGLTIYAQVNDLGEDTVEKDATQRRETEITLEFPTKIEPKDSVAAEIKIDPDVQIDGHEDNAISFGSQLASKASTFNSDGVEDVLTVVIKPSDAGLLPGLTISGANVDFVDGVYVFQAKIDASGNITGLDGLTLKVAQDWAGDFELPVLFVTTDTLSGDEKSFKENIPVQILPVADVPDSSPDQPLDNNVTPNVTLDIKGTLGLDSDKQPVNDLNNDVPTDDGIGYEDGLIQLDLSVDFADVRNSSGAGRETLTSIKLTLADTALGEFVHPDGTTIGTSIEFTAAEIAAGALDNVLFKPKENYPIGAGKIRSRLMSRVKLPILRLLIKRHWHQVLIIKMYVHLPMTSRLK